MKLKAGYYRNTAAKMDESLCHVYDHGPATRRLAEYGDVLPLKNQGMAKGRPGSDQELAIITSQLRRRISSATVRANFTCLLERMAQVGEGAKRAGKRRSWERLEEERMRRDRQAQWLARVRGVGLVHRGQFFA